MLRKSLQQTISRAMLYAPKKSLSPTSYRLFSTSLAYRQESEAMKPTSGKKKDKLRKWDKLNPILYRLTRF
jgi:hypothetical protein